MSTVAKLGFRLRHLGVAVPEFAQAAESLKLLFGYEVIAGPVLDPIQRVEVAFLQQGGADQPQIELVAPLGADSPISSMLTKNVGAYHLCFETNDIVAALEHAKNLGCFVVSEPAPAVAFGGRKIAWLFTPTRQLFELLEVASEQEKA